MLYEGPATGNFCQRDAESCRILIDSLIPDSIPIADLRYHAIRFYGRAQKFTRIIVKDLIPDSRITLIPLVIPLDS